MSWASENQDHPVVKALVEKGCALDEIPDEVRLIGLERPPEAVFEHFRKTLDLCVKCGSDDHWTSFHVGRLAGYKGCDYGHHAQVDGEHLHHGCRNCGFDWTTPTLAATDADAGRVE